MCSTRRLGCPAVAPAGSRCAGPVPPLDQSRVSEVATRAEYAERASHQLAHWAQGTGQPGELLAARALRCTVMGLKAQLRDDLTTAIKSRDELTKSTIRMALSAITSAEVAGDTAPPVSSTSPRCCGC